MKSILLIHWSPSNLGVVQNILLELQKEAQPVDTLQIKYLNEKSKFWKDRAIKNTSLFNLVYLVYQIIKINWKIFFYDRVYIFGTNAIIFALPQFYLNKNKIVAHLNELPKFLDSELFIFSNIERLTLRKIKWLVVSNHDRLTILKEYLAPTNTAFILENILNYNFYTSENKNQVPEIKKQDGFRFIYAGMISKNRDIDLLISFFKGNNKAELNLVGPIDVTYKDEFHSSIKGVANVKWSGEVSFNEVQKLILYSDFSIALYTLSNFNNRYCAPVKIHEYIYQRRPVLVYDNPSLKNLIHDFKIALVIHDLKTEKGDEFNERLIKFYNNLSNQKFLEFETESYHNFRSEFSRLRSIAFS